MSNNPLRHHSARHYIHAPSSLFVSSAIITMRQAAWQRCGTKRRSGGDSKARTRRTETPLKLSPRRVTVILTAVLHFHACSSRKQHATNRKQTPEPLITLSTSHKHGRTTHNNFRSLWAKSATPHGMCGKYRPFRIEWHAFVRPFVVLRKSQHP